MLNAIKRHKKILFFLAALAWFFRFQPLGVVNVDGDDEERQLLRNRWTGAVIWIDSRGYCGVGRSSWKGHECGLLGDIKEMIWPAAKKAVATVAAPAEDATAAPADEALDATELRRRKDKLYEGFEQYMPVPTK